MSVRSTEIIDLLPSLRRYALALVGDQGRADALVEVCLERLLAEQAHVSGRALRLTLFALFDLIHDETLHADRPEAAVAAGGSLAHSLHDLPLEERKALLLVTVEHFSQSDAGAILRVPAPVIARRVLAARERLRRALSRKVLVIEDEPVMAMSIAHIVTRMGHEVCGVAHTRREALARVRETRPGLILADVRLRDGDNGIATVREIVRQVSAPVIFITGHAQDLIAEQQLRPTLVVGKPFAPHTLEAAVRRVLENEISG
jgi:CheY-like chemotaxis protein